MSDPAVGDSHQKDRMATSFGRQSSSYSQGRPDYPDAAVADLLDTDARVVADIGAGTGKLTSSLLAPGRTVYAIDPDRDMLATLSEALPTVQAMVGSAEAIPLDNGVVDALTYGQAWHWVQPDAATAEAARVLRPGGTIGLVWNIRDESVPWVATLTEIVSASEAELFVARGGPRFRSHFGSVRHTQIDWDRHMTGDQLVAMAASRSHVITSTDAERTRILGAVRELADEVADGDGVIVLPYRTHVYRAERAVSTGLGSS
jgi:ubiquinone/menaquinone biosynthesis C-methylase UbiE